MPTILSHLRRRALIEWRRRWWLQVLGFFAIWAPCEAVVRRLHLPVPASILGFALLLLALETRAISVWSFRRGAAVLLAHLVLFLIPVILAMTSHPELLSLIGLKLLATVLIGTPLVMLGTATVVEIGHRLRTRQAAQEDRAELPRIHLPSTTSAPSRT